MNSFHVSVSRCIQKSNNVFYPMYVEINNLDKLKEVASFDHALGKYKDNHRSDPNFQGCDVLFCDLDNDHSDDPDDWKTIDDVSDIFEDTPFYYICSRNHMKGKDGKEPRPKYHLYFPLSARINESGAYRRLWERVAAFAGANGIIFDSGAKDAARFYYGVEKSDGGFFDGEKAVDQLPLPEVKEKPQNENESFEDWVENAEQKKSIWFLDNFFVKHGIWSGKRYSVKNGPHQGGVAICVTCPWEQDHTADTGEAQTVIIVDKSGKLNYLCRHQHCQDKSWMNFRQYYEGKKNDNDYVIPSISEFEEKIVKWLIPGYIPSNQITVMAGDGGSGKTTLWCNIVAGISSGKPCALENTVPEEFRNREPKTVLVFSAEDSPEYTLSRRLKKNGADLHRIFTVAIKDDRFKDIKFDNPFLEGLIEKYRPELVVFDPLQAFVDPKIRMGDRNAMRQSLIPVVGFCEKYNSTALIIVHTNKQSGVWGRKRIADSADIWDLSRSVMIVGETAENGIRYISQEKNNYAPPAETILFSLDNEIVNVKGTTFKKDRDFVNEEFNKKSSERTAPEKERAKAALIEFLESDDMKPKLMSEVNEMAKAHSITQKTLRSAKEELKAEGKIKYYPGGGNERAKWRLGLIPSE